MRGYRFYSDFYKFDIFYYISCSTNYFISQLSKDTLNSDVLCFILAVSAALVLFCNKFGMGVFRWFIHMILSLGYTVRWILLLNVRFMLVTH